MNNKKLIIYSVSAIIGVLILSLVLSYLTTLRDPFTVSFKRLYPAAFIGSRIISINDVEQGIMIGEKFGLSRSQAHDKFIGDEKAYALVKDLNLSVARDAAADEVRYYVKGNETDYSNLLKTYFNNSQSVFDKYVVTPQIMDAALRMKYNNDIKSTSEAYRRAQNVLERHKKGEKFDDLAKAESDDKTTGQLGGDLGFYESGQVIPELEDQISISALGEVRQEIIVSRLGYHIIYPIEYANVEGKKLWHVKHILFVTEGYDAWLDKQLDKISIKFIKQF